MVDKQLKEYASSVYNMPNATDEQLNTIEDTLGYNAYLLRISLNDFKDVFIKEFKVTFIGKQINKLMRWK